MLSEISSGITLRITRFADSSELECTKLPIGLQGNCSSKLDFAGAKWEVESTINPANDRPDGLDFHATFTVTESVAHDISVGIELPVEKWSRDTFLMMPAAAYNGNRYKFRAYSYPPMIHEPEDIGPNAPIIVSDVPRLNYEDGEPSRIQVLTGDLTTPCISFYQPHAHVGVILLTDQGNEFGNHGLTVEENSGRSQACLRIESPGVRRDTLYTMCNTSTPSWDRGITLKKSQQVSIRFRLYVFHADNTQSLYHRFKEVRKDLSGPVKLKHELPFSAAWSIIEEKYQKENWNNEGYYQVGTSESSATSMFQDWQTGWTGGGMVPFAMLLAGCRQSQDQAMKNMDWLFATAQYPSGLFCAGYHAGKYFDDGFSHPECKDWVMIRKESDAFYFVMKTFIALGKMKPGHALPESWIHGTTKLADRLADTFQRYGQLGRYLDLNSGDVVVGGSTSAAMAPGAFALAGEFFQKPSYIEVAESLADKLYENDVKSGVTTGGPGEILSSPDSESAFAMLESFIVLYEVTKNSKWLSRATEMAEQCMTWCASYDYKFPKNSWFGRLDMKGAGSVWANVQNKHSAPGICTLSGDSLFKLFRYTGDRVFLELIQEISHNLTQFICRDDRQIGDPKSMRKGYVCERVNFSDWEGKDNIGGSLFGSCWPEVSIMFSTIELPGIYVQPDTGLLCAIDNVDAKLSKNEKGETILICGNPTAFDAKVRIFAETSTDAKKILGQAACLQWSTIEIPAGKSVSVTCLC